MTPHLDTQDKLLSTRSLLTTESAEEYSALCKALDQQIQPRDFMEKMYVEDMVDIICDTLRLRRMKTSLINAALPGALERLLTRLLRKPGQFPDANREEAQTLAYKWCSCDVTKAQV